MAYNELIKDISRIRDYMREFFVYGFKSREEIGIKSARSYDNERRRIESWLGDYMSFRQDASGKNVFISVDSRRVPQNPLYQMWKTKSFTKNDITLHFWLLDILSVDSSKSLVDIINTIDNDYLPMFQNADPMDESTLRKKLKEYTNLGLIIAEKHGKQLLYKLPADEINLHSWYDAIAFFAEANPVGIVGSFLMDKFSDLSGCFSYKHSYLLFAPDTSILLDLLTAINDRKRVELEIYPNKRRTVLPLKIFISTQGGRQYVAGCNIRTRRIMFFRLDTIQKVKHMEVVSDYCIYSTVFKEYCNHLWGVASGNDGQLEHIAMTLKIEADERHIVQRLEREKRCGKVEQLNDTLWRFTADVYDTQEMLPWLRTFIGRIVSISCSNKVVEERFQSDIFTMVKMYGGGGDDV